MLIKSLYGLKQASKQWFSKLSYSLNDIGFSQFFYDHSLFIREIGNNFIVSLVYVDDIILADKFVSNIKQVTQYLNKAFKVNDLGDLKFLFGLEIVRSSNAIHMLLMSSLILVS